MEEPKKKELAVIHETFLRQLVEAVNQRGIQKEDIVTIIDQGETGFFLLYYK